MQDLSAGRYILKRLADDWKLLLCILFGVIVSASLIAGAPVYVDTLQRQGFDTTIDRSRSGSLDILTFAPHVSLDRTTLLETDALVDRTVLRYIPGVKRGSERFLRGPTNLVGFPYAPLTPTAEEIVSRGYFQTLSNVEKHVTFNEGRMASDLVVAGARGPVVEVVLSASLASRFKVNVGDELVLAPSFGDATRVTAVVVGTITPIDINHEFWQHNAAFFLDPPPLSETPDDGVEVDPEEPPVVLFTTREALVAGVGQAFPGTMVVSTWYIFSDREGLKQWSASDLGSRLDAIETDLVLDMPGTGLFTGLNVIVARYERRSFFTAVPMLLLLVVMVITVLYYLAMMVSYLVQSREADVALLRSRGIGTVQLLRLYAVEGAVLVLVGVILAPFAAMGAIALAGKLPYFNAITGGSFLPVNFRWEPFAMAAGAGLLGLAIFVIPGVLGARTGLIIHKLRSSRPPSVPLFQRYYLDIAVLAVGGLVFWELHERGHVVSGGLFSGVQVNDVLLFAPVLFLIGVALLFMRLFPLLVKFVSGESAALLHLATAAALAVLVPSVVYADVRDGNGFAWLTPVALLAAAAATHWAAHRAQRPASRIAWLAAQGAAVALFGFVRSPVVGETSFVPTVVLFCIPPAQIAFRLLASSSQAAPVWVSMGLWRMARNPLQYSWLVLLLVMVTGLGIMATTVGGTLDLSHRDRVAYNVASDIRVGGIPWFLAVNAGRDTKDRYLAIPGVTAVSMAFRSDGKVGTTLDGSWFDLLALESEDFPYISWWRDDFSHQPLTGLMRALQSTVRSEPVWVPDEATDLRVWVKPEHEYPGVFLWMVLEDAHGRMATVSFGRLGPPEWVLMTARIPDRIRRPAKLVSIQLNEGGYGAVGTPGTILLDHVHAGVDGGDEQVIEDFEGLMRWTPMPTSLISSDRVSVDDDSYEGESAALFSFGKETNAGVRGFYHAERGTALPVVVSSSFVDYTGIRVGDRTLVQVAGRLVPIVVRDTADFFPTLNPHRRGFVVADLDSALRRINLASLGGNLVPNELFISEAPGAGSAVNRVVRGMVLRTDLVQDKADQLQALEADPLITAGWRAMVLLSIGIIVVVAGAGYATYLLSYAHRSQSEMGFLRSLGLSRSQMTGLLTLEHLAIVIVGVGLGTWAGFQMSTLMVSAVAVTEDGSRVVPPFILTTDWSYMLPIYGALAVIFALSLSRLIRGAQKLDVSLVSKAEAG